MAIVAAAALTWAFWPVRIEPSMATAVAGSPTILYKNAGTGSQLLTIPKGGHVNVLKLSGTPGDEWVLVQVVNGNKAGQTGYVRGSDLDHWDSADPARRLALIRRFMSGASADEARKHEALQRLITDFPNAPAAREAHMDLAAMHLAAIHRVKDAGQPVTAAQSHIDSARAHLDAAGVEPSLAGTVQEQRRELDALTAEPAKAANAGTEQPPPPKAPSEQQTQAWLSQARAKLKNGDYNEAENLVRRVLRWQPTNPDANRLYKDIREAKEYLEIIK